MSRKGWGVGWMVGKEVGWGLTVVVIQSRAFDTQGGTIWFGCEDWLSSKRLLRGSHWKELKIDNEKHVEGFRVQKSKALQWLGNFGSEVAPGCEPSRDMTVFVATSGNLGLSCRVRTRFLEL